jgi:hypothetical protein
MLNGRSGHSYQIASKVFVSWLYPTKVQPNQGSDDVIVNIGCFMKMEPSLITKPIGPSKKVS